MLRFIHLYIRLSVQYPFFYLFHSSGGCPVCPHTTAIGRRHITSPCDSLLLIISRSSCSLRGRWLCRGVLCHQLTGRWNQRENVDRNAAFRVVIKSKLKTPRQITIAGHIQIHTCLFTAYQHTFNVSSFVLIMPCSKPSCIVCATTTFTSLSLAAWSSFIAQKFPLYASASILSLFRQCWLHI